MENPVRVFGFGLMAAVFLAAFAAEAAAVGPGWGDAPGKKLPPPVMGSPGRSAGPGELLLECPRVFAGIKGDLLPTDWTATDPGRPASFVKSQVDRDGLYCVYRVPSESRAGHASVRRLAPAGYRCETDGSGRFRCRRLGR